MAIQLNQAGFDYAKKLISEGKVDDDLHGDWGAENPDREKQNRFIEEYGYESYGQWHLGINLDDGPETKEAYSFPYGNYTQVVRSGLIAAEERAAQYGYEEIRDAAKLLLSMLD